MCMMVVNRNGVIKNKRKVMEFSFKKGKKGAKMSFLGSLTFFFLTKKGNYNVETDL